MWEYKKLIFNQLIIISGTGKPDATQIISAFELVAKTLLFHWPRVAKTGLYMQLDFIFSPLKPQSRLASQGVKQKGQTVQGAADVDVPEISVAAMREAIINAFCDRDYRDPDYVQVAIFKDRVEIRNPDG